MLKSAVVHYREGGMRRVLWKSYYKFFESDKVERFLTRTLGPEYHEKFLIWPKVGYWPHLRNPRSFNEKLTHRKLFTDKEIFTEVEDKWMVRDYVEEKVGEDILPEALHVTDNPDTIPWQELPDRFVIKANHGSGWNKIVENKDEEDFEEIKEQCREWLGKKYGTEKNEYWYWDIEPKIIVEEFLESDFSDQIRDYKFFVFNGEVEYVEVDHDRYTNHRRTFYDKKWELQEFEHRYPRGPITEEPKDLDNMVDVAESIAKEFEYIRVDLYYPSKGEVYFGELTVCHESGNGRFKPKKWDFKLGEKWNRNPN